MAKSWIVVDLDGTLSDCSPRVHLAEQKLWDEFHAGIPNDKVHEEVHDLLVDLTAAYGEAVNVLVLTGRTEDHAEPTRRWLNTHCEDIPIDQMIFRPVKDRRPDHEFKVAALTEFFGSAEGVVGNVRFVLEDRDAVTEALRNMGLPVWQVRPGAF